MTRSLLALSLLAASATLGVAQRPVECRLPVPGYGPTPQARLVTAEPCTHPNPDPQATEAEPDGFPRDLADRCGAQPRGLLQPPHSQHPYPDTPPLVYRFANLTPQELHLAGPALSLLATADGHTGTYTAAQLPSGATAPVFAFPANAGLAYANPPGVALPAEYSVELLFRLDELANWRRVVGFNEHTDDVGIYLKNGLLEFYGPATGQFAAMPPALPNEWLHVVLVRRRAKNRYFVMELYANGQHVLTVPTGAESHVGLGGQMVFFQDDEQVPNEASSGQVAGISLYPYALGPLQAQRCAQLALAPTPIGQDVDGRLLTTPEPLLQSVVDGRQGPPPHPGCSACQPLEFVQHEEAPELPEASPVLLVEALPVVAYESYPALPPLPEPDEALPQPAQPLAEVAEAKPAEPAVEWAFYPNPATLGVWVRGANPNLPLHATLRDAAGREVPGLAVQPHGAAAYVAWPAETARGHYFLTVSQGNHTHTQRIVLH